MDHLSSCGKGGGAAAAVVNEWDENEEKELSMAHLNRQQVPQKSKGQEAAVEGGERVEDLHEPAGRRDLCSLLSNSGRNGNKPASMPTNSAQLTIFYAGSVCVYDAVAPEKADAIMLVAAAVAAAATRNELNVKKCPITDVSPTAADVPVVVLTRSPSLQSTSVPTPQHLLSNPGSSHCKLQAELPIARRHSLQRFLEKRRGRLVSKNPYPSNKMDCSGGHLGSEVSTPL